MTVLPTLVSRMKANPISTTFQSLSINVAQITMCSLQRPHVIYVSNVNNLSSNRIPSTPVHSSSINEARYNRLLHPRASLKHSHISTMESPNLHVAMFPWLATGHITPYVHLSNLFAEKGYRVSFFIPAKTQTKFNHLNLYPGLFQFIPLAIKVQGLPDGTETMADVGLDQQHLIAKAFDLTQDQIVILLSKLKPDLVFYDFAYWIPTVAKPLGIKSIYMSAISAVSSLVFVPSIFEGKGEYVGPPEIYPGSSAAKTKPFEQRDTKYVVTEIDGVISSIQRVYTSFKNADALCFRACHEIEGPFLDYLQSQNNKPVLTIGSVLSYPSNTTLEKRWADWLGGFEKGSVVYCAFGSECVLDKDQFQELVLGLEMTGLPFLVRLKPPTGCATLEEALPEGFEERVRGRGVVHGGWVQQPLILAHPSVGCFMCHCGFGSLWEALVSTCQLVLVPHFGDQFVNSKFLSKGLKVAVEVERREDDGWFSRDCVCNAVKLVMDEQSVVGEELRANHLKLYKFLADEGFQSSYLDRFFSSLEDLRN